MSNNQKAHVQRLLALADVKINSNRSWDIQVHNEDMYNRVLSKGSIGLGESYVDGWWDSKKLDEFFNKILSAQLNKKVKSIRFALAYLRAVLLNTQRKSKAFEIGGEHYNLGNDFYKLMLDKRMVYTCGYWKNAKTLDEAQEAKLDLVCKKIGLKPGMTVLDIGCGWGSFAKFAAEKYKAKVTGVSVSREQIELAKKLCKGLNVEFKLMDYRDIQGKYDRVVSLGMFEHVGYKNYRTYMKVARRVLKDDGLFLLHTIGGNTPVKRTDEWISKYIFPDSMLPSASQISKAYEGLFVMEDWHNFGIDYDKTLMAWYKNFTRNWDKIKKQDPKYTERFKRMWSYYLLACAGSFRARKNQLWQIVLSKKGIPQGYNSIR